jgi:5-formyltetrahydrofolate cyclo-ligase
VRGEIRARLEPLPEEARAALGERVAALSLELPEYRQASTIALYAAMPAELPTQELLRAATRDGRRCLLPLVRPERRLEFALVSNWENLSAGRYGVLEPGDDCERVEFASADLVFVPGLAFDPRGARLGRGGGYYDRVLGSRAPVLAPTDRAPVFGLAHDWQVLEAVPSGEQDVPVDGIVTEQRILRVEHAG